MIPIIEIAGWGVAQGKRETRQPRRGALVLARWLVGLPLGAFFGFVGWMKAMAPLPELHLHHAWTVWLPEALGRAVGWSEMAGVALLVAALAVPRLARWHRAVAGYFIINQLAAAAVHLAAGEGGALPQNLVLIAAFAFLAATARRAPKADNQWERTA